MMKIIISLWIIAFVLTEESSYEKSLVRIIQDAGHIVEVHKVHTEDKYILTVFRLPSKLQNPKVALLMHGTTKTFFESFIGLFSSAADYVIGGNGASLAYLLADNGYDVWLGNARGNIFSQVHEKLNKTSHDFWKFSFHEIAVYDVAAMIDYALNALNRTKLCYVGHSQGTTAIFVLLSMKPEYNSKITTAYLLAPVAYMRYPNPLLKPAAQMVNQIVDLVHTTKVYEFFPLNEETRRMTEYFCRNNLVQCRNSYMILGGYGTSQFNEDLMPKVFQFLPASVSYMQLQHYAQIINAKGRFLRFDHQRQQNLKIYNQPIPPPYNLSNIHTNLYFLYGVDDIIANPKDVEYLIERLRSSAVAIKKINNWNHFDFCFGKDIQKKLNNVILQNMKLCD